MDVMRVARAYEQNIAEGLVWLREAEYNARFMDYLRAKKFQQAFLAMGRAAMQNYFTEFSYFEYTKHLQNPELNIVGVGAEATVVRENGVVSKYLTGKSRNPEETVEKYISRNEVVSRVMGDFVPHTEVDIATIKLFKHNKAKPYVRLTQENINFKPEHVDPQKLFMDEDMKYLEARKHELDKVYYAYSTNKLKDRERMRLKLEAEHPELQSELRELASRAMQLFEEEGLLLDFVNTGNVVYGSKKGEAPRIYMLDTLAVELDEKDMIGHGSPFWNTDRYVDSLMEFACRVNPEYIEQIVTDWEPEESTN